MLERTPARAGPARQAELEVDLQKLSASTTAFLIKHSPGLRTDIHDRGRTCAHRAAAARTHTTHRREAHDLHRYRPQQPRATMVASLPDDWRTPRPRDEGLPPAKYLGKPHIGQLNAERRQAPCLSPDGTRLAAGGYDKKIIVWDAASQKKVLDVDVGDWVECLDWSVMERRGLRRRLRQAGEVV